MEVQWAERSWQPLAGVRSQWLIVGSLPGLFAAATRDFTKRWDTGPDWMQPPPQASYPLVIGSRRSAVVHLDPGTDEWLGSVGRAGFRRLGDLVTVNAWLTQLPSTGEAAGEIVVHVGERRVGTLSAAVAQEFAPELAAAAFYDEFVPVRGILLPADRYGTAMLELRLPTPRLSGAHRRRHLGML